MSYVYKTNKINSGETLVTETRPLDEKINGFQTVVESDDYDSRTVINVFIISNNCIINVTA